MPDPVINPRIASDYGPFGAKFHQVAIYTTDVGDSVQPYFEMGYDNWKTDTAVLVGYRRAAHSLVWVPETCQADMAFNYDIMPLELEFLQYHGPSRHHERSLLDHIPFISHMSVHVDSVREIIEKFKEDYGTIPIHVFVTQDHTNPAVKDKKRFIECIFDTRAWFGYDIKCIERVAWDTDATAQGILTDTGLAAVIS